MALRAATREVDLTPWEALLRAVRLAAGRVEWVDEQLEDAVRRADGDVAGSPTVQTWLELSRRERVLMYRTTKAAIDAGLAERVVRQVELEGRIIGEVIGRSLDVLELTQEQRTAVFTESMRLVQDIENVLGDTSV